jgi:HSP20 family protein
MIVHYVDPAGLPRPAADRRSGKEDISMKTGLTKRDPFALSDAWDPFREMRRMQYDMDRLFGRLMGAEMPAPETGFGEWTPATESFRKGDSLVIKCQLPGVDPGDVDLTYDENTGQLMIEGERKAEKETKEEDYLYRELEYGTFERRFTLPEGVKTDQLKAKFDKGILEITAPAPALTKGKKIEIESKHGEIEKSAKKAA